MSSSPHARYRDRLSLLSTDELLTGAVRELGSPHACWRDRVWSRMSGRFTPDAAPFGDFLFESHGPPQAICRVEAFDAPPVPAPFDSPCIRTAAGWLRVTRFPCDAALPALPSVLATPGRATVVRYHPLGRCVIRFEQDERTLFAKVFASKRGKHVHRVGVALWRAARLGELESSVAEPERWDPDARTLWQHRLAGRPVGERLRGADGPLLAHRIGRAAASLTRCHLDIEEVFDGAAQMSRSARHGADLRDRVPRLAASITQLLARIATVHAAAAPRKMRPIHGSLHPNQWLEDGPRVGVVDFDSVSLGEPEKDAGTFLGDLDSDDALKDSIAQMARSFLAGYESVVGPLDRNLVHAYRVHQQLTKALQAARAVHPDGHWRAEKKLLGAIACLSEGPS